MLDFVISINNDKTKNQQYLFLIYSNPHLMIALGASQGSTDQQIYYSLCKCTDVYTHDPYTAGESSIPIITNMDFSSTNTSGLKAYINWSSGYLGTSQPSNNLSYFQTYRLQSKGDNIILDYIEPYIKLPPGYSLAIYYNGNNLWGSIAIQYIETSDNI